MADEMGAFRTDVEIENPARPGERVRLPNVLVDTGAELSWFPARDLDALGIPRRKFMRFRQASGTVIERWTGGAIVHAADTSTLVSTRLQLVVWRMPSVFSKPLTSMGYRQSSRLGEAGRSIYDCLS